MELAGVTLMGTFAIVCDLMRDWRNVPGSATVLPWLDQYVSEYSITARSHGYAVLNGTIAPGELQILGVENGTAVATRSEQKLLA